MTPTKRKSVKRRDPMPHNVTPMLATLIAEPFDGDGWLFEVKWDGFRAVAELERGSARVYSRNLLPLDHRFPPIVPALKKIKHDAVFDGEIVILDAHGKSHFQLLQNYQRTGKGTLAYYVFDLLYLDGRDLRSLPLIERKQKLATILDGEEIVRYSEHVEHDGISFFEAAVRAGLEGIMAKRADSPYLEGFRSENWLKIKARRQQEAVIGGFTEPRRTRQGLGSLVLGVYEDKEFTYIGHCGGGFDNQGLRQMRARLEPLEQLACPFKKKPKPKTNAPVHWVTPKLVCEVAFQEWTDDGTMRQPIFLGLREDKAATTITREMPQATG